MVKLLLKGILHALQSTEEGICAVGLAACTFMVFAQAVNRYWLHFRIMWLGDMALYTFVFFMFVAGALTTWQERHIAVTFLRDHLRDHLFMRKPGAMVIYRIFIDVIAIAVAGIFLSPAYKFMLRALQYPEWATLVPWFNASWLKISLFGTMVLIMVHLLVIIRRDVGDITKSWHPGLRSKE